MNDKIIMDEKGVETSGSQKHMSIKKLILLLALVIGLMVFSIGAITDWFKTNPFASFMQANPNWLIVTLLVVFASIILDSIVMQVYVKVFKKDYTFKQALKITLIGRFFNGVTPAASGGQFVQLFVFGKQGVKSKDAIAILMLRFITSQTVLVLLSLALFIFRFDLYVNGLKLDFMVGLAAIGFASNSVVLISLFLVTYSKTIHGLLVRIYGFFYGKIRRKPEKVQEKIEALGKKIEDIRFGANILLKKKRILFSSFLIMTISSFMIYASAQFAGLSVGAPYGFSTNGIAKVIDISTLSMFVSTMNSLVPIPGASGTTELSFGRVFESYIHYIDPTIAKEVVKEIISAQTIIWRLANFTIPLLVGFVVYLTSKDGLGLVKKPKLHKEDVRVSK